MFRAGAYATSGRNSSPRGLRRAEWCCGRALSLLQLGGRERRAHASLRLGTEPQAQGELRNKITRKMAGRDVVP